MENRQPQSSDRAAKLRAKKKKTLKIVLIAVISFIVVLVLGLVGVYFYLNLDQMHTQELSSSDLEIDLPFIEQWKKDNHYEDMTITNIALFGIDSRKGETVGRSDATMILSVNHQKNSVKLISVMRDSYVYFPDHGPDYPNWGASHDKLTHAYVYGGAQLAVKVLNSNFNMDITDYVTVDFFQLADVIDVLGGVTIDVTAGEMREININLLEQESTDFLQTYGEQIHLSGPQAVAFARIRNIGGDQGRTDRQRTVLMALFEQLKGSDWTKLLSLARTVIPMVTTSFTPNDLIKFIPVLMNADAEIAQTMIPGKYDNARDAMIDGVYYMEYDLESATKHIYDFIYKDIDPNADPEETKSTVSSANAGSGVQ